jgi:hypothetical protein
MSSMELMSLIVLPFVCTASYVVHIYIPSISAGIRAAEMQLDPSTVLESPLPLPNLINFVATIVVVTVLCDVGVKNSNNDISMQRHPQESKYGIVRVTKLLLQSIIKLLAYGSVFLAATLIAGAPVTRNVAHSTLFGIYVACCPFALHFDVSTLLSILSFHNNNNSSSNNKDNNNNNSSTGSGNKSNSKAFTDKSSERIAINQVQCSFIGIVIATLVIPLDWGLQFQLWPGPLIIGHTIGILAVSLEYMLSSFAIAVGFTHRDSYKTRKV